MKRIAAILSLLLSFAVIAAPSPLWACACGCGVFEVGTTPMLATHVGGMAYLEYDYLNQDQNWNRYSKGDDAANNDKHIQTSFVTAGLQYFFSKDWGMMAEVPYDYRYLKTSPDGVNLAEYKHGSIGDIRVKGVYTGLSSDLTTGLTFGFKLPTGDFTYPGFDRDTEIGSGSTDLLGGFYHIGGFGPLSNLHWFVNGQIDQPFAISGGYRPGGEFDAALGGYVDHLSVGPVGVAPLAQMLYSHRWRDSGVLADAPDTGYDRLVVGPGVQLGYGSYQLYANVGFPVYQYTNGNQLVASELYSMTFGYTF